MRTITRFSWLALLVVGLAAPVAEAGKAGGSSEAAKPQDGVMHVDDKAGVFTAGGVDTATAKFDGVTFKARTHFTVVTRSSVPESKKKDLDATKGDKSKASAFFSDWAHELAKAKGEVGVFVLAYVEGDKFFVKAITDKANDVHRHFGDSDATQLEGKLIESFRSAKGKTGDEAKKARDAGLLESTTFVIDQLKDTSLPADTKLHSDTKKESGGMSILGWVCIAGVVILGIWLVIAVIRMLTGGVNGYGGGYGGGGGGGGGGGMGFMGGLMGGMFGAMAGMYLYDQFTGGHHYNDNYGSGSDNGGGGDNYGGSQDTGEGNFDGGSEGTGGGDWGDSGGGGGDTGGGGDWGGDSGGGDSGGGGDWGGGGGDMGGGGDW